jgi:hypothetical protein
VADGFAQIENAENLKPVLVSIEEGWQIGYLLESLQIGYRLRPTGKCRAM